MRHIRTLILLVFWAVPLCALLLFALSKSNVRDLRDGVHIISNDTVELELEVADGNFRSNQLMNRKTKEKLFLSGEEFSLKAGLKTKLGWFEADGKPRFGLKPPHIITPDKCQPVEIGKAKGKTSFLLYYPDLKLSLRLNYYFLKGESFIHRDLEVENLGEDEIVIEEAKLGNWVVNGNVTAGGKGLPVFVNDLWFFSGETPWFEAVGTGNTVTFCQHPSAFLKTNEKWTSDRSLMGGGKEGARKFLAEYIKSVVLPPRFVTVYNTWCDFREDGLTTEHTVDTFLKLCSGLRTFGAKIDYCVVDDGWFNKEKVYETNEKRFPKGLAEVSELITPYGSGLGLWLSYSSMMNDLKALAQSGYEAANNYYMCLSGPKYNKDLRDAIKNRITTDEVKCFKHDFNYFTCSRPGHGHLYSEEQSTEANMRETAAILDMERSLDPDIHQSITTGINHSPWWLKHARILWMGGKDKDYDYSYPVTSRSQAEMRYRDGSLYKLLRVDKEFFPLYAFMTHGMINGLLDTAGPWQDDLQWSDYIMNYLGRGTSIRELYIHPRELNEKKFEVLGRGLNWANEHNDLMLKSEMILGDPSQNELYGFRGHDDAGHVYASLRNPRFLDEEVKISDLGIDSEYYRISYPYHMIRETKNYPTIKIPAESVMIVESLELRELTYPALINVRFQRNNITGSSARFVINSEGSDKNPIYLYSPFAVKRFLGLHNISEIKKHLLSGERPGAQDIRRVKAEDLSIESNAFYCSVSVPEGASSLLVWTINDKDADMILTDNSAEVKLQFTSFPNHGWKVAVAPIGKGEHEFVGKVVRSKRPVTVMDLQLRSSYSLPALELQLIHKVARGQNINNYELPMPVSQETLNETLSLFEKAKLTTAPREVWNDVEEATLSVEVFDVNGDAYTNKVVLVNDVPIGLLPNNQPPLSSWQIVSIQLPDEVFKTLGNANNVGIIDETGDAYKIRNIKLRIKRKSQKRHREMQDSGVFCSSPSWSLREGELVKLDGSSFLILCE